METPGHLAPHWRDPNTRPSRTPVTVWHERWGTEVTSTGSEKTKPLPQLIAALASFKTVSAKLILLWKKKKKNPSQTEVETQYGRVACSCTQIHFYTQWGLDVFVRYKTDLFEPTLKFHTEEGKTAKANFRHLRNKLQEETYLCAFPSWEPSNVEAFWCFCSYWLQYASVYIVLLHWQALASLSFTSFPLGFFFSKKYFLGRVELELE